MCPWLTPIPNTKRPGYASDSAFQPACMAIAVRAAMLAIPVAAFNFVDDERIIAAFTNASRPTVSGYQYVPNPRPSISCTTSRTFEPGTPSSDPLHRPIRPRSGFGWFWGALSLLMNRNYPT